MVWFDSLKRNVENHLIMVFHKQQIYGIMFFVIILHDVKK